MVMVGADVEALRALSKQMSDSAARLDGIAASLGSEVSHSPWSGIDATQFSSDWWQRLRPILTKAAQALQVGAEDLRRNAEEQENASSAFAPRGAGGGVALLPVPDWGDMRIVWPEWANADEVQRRGNLRKEIRDLWESMTDSEREKWLRNYANVLADEKGLDRPTVRFYTLDAPSGIRASWCEREGELGCVESRTLLINRDILSDPDSINTVAHELRHVEQYEMVRRLDEGLVQHGQVLPAGRGDGVSEQVVQEWKSNTEVYEHGPEALETDAERQQMKAYLNQPLETDARRAARKATNEMTLERFETIRESGAKPEVEKSIPTGEQQWWEPFLQVLRLMA